MRSLRGRLILSHILPLLLVLPLMALVFYFAWYSYTALASVTTMLGPSIADLKTHAELVARLAGLQEDLWTDAGLAQAALGELSAGTVAVTLLDRSGQLLATSPISGSSSTANPGQEQDVATVLAGARSSQVLVTTARTGSRVRIVTPVLGADERLLGVLLVSHEVTTAQDVLGQTILLLAVSVVVLLIAGVGVDPGLPCGWTVRWSRRRPPSTRWPPASRWMPCLSSTSARYRRPLSSGQRAGGTAAQPGGGAPAPAGQPGA